MFESKLYKFVCITEFRLDHKSLVARGNLLYQIQIFPRQSLDHVCF